MSAHEVPAEDAPDESSILRRSGNVPRALDLAPKPQRWRDRIRDWLLAKPQAEPATVPGPFLQPAAGRIGICCSGGGIRSAAYNLGALQVLDAHNVLARAQFLAAVSGGSYIAGSWATVASAPDKGTGGFDADEATVPSDSGNGTGASDSVKTTVPSDSGNGTGASDSDEGAMQPASDKEPPPKAPYAPGSPEEEHLRNHSSYLAPGFGGRLRLVLRLLLGMGVNLLFVAAALYIAGLLYGWLLSSAPVHPELKGTARVLHLNATAWLVVVVPAGLAGVLALIELTIRGSDRGSTWRETWLSRLLRLALFLLVFSIGVPFLLMLLHRHAPPVTLQAAGKAVGAPVAEPKTSSGQASGFLKLINLGALTTAALGAVRAFVARRKSFLALFAGAIAGPILIFVTFLGFAAEAARHGPNSSEVPWIAAAVGLLGFFTFVADPTQWSLHPFYRRRLSEAFFVKRVRPDPSGPIEAEPLAYGEPFPITNLKPRDGGPLPVNDAQAATNAADGIAQSSNGHGPGATAGPPAQRVPELLICAAANISDEGATPPGRGAVPFLFSARELGGPVVGQIGTHDYENLLDKRSRDITLPAAVAMSGAALAPSMGKKSVRALTFLLALTNLRLGVWLPNPRRAANLKARWAARAARAILGSGLAKKVKLEARGNRIFPPAWYLIYELLGRHKLNDRYLYITDGGHYENLGLVELLRRGCTTIYCLDASGDRPETFTVLGEAIALARSEVGVDVDIDPTSMRPPATGGPPANDHAIGTFHYRNSRAAENGKPEEGTLVYCKTAVTTAAPWDVQAFEEKEKFFPNDSIFDQLFNAEKFEAYRALGARTTERALDSLHNELLRRETHRVLVTQARENKMIQYESLRTEVSTRVPQLDGQPDLRGVLQQIAEDERTCGRPPLVAVVEDIELTTTELWEQAKQIGLRRLPAKRFRHQRLKTIHDYWMSHDTPASSNGAGPGKNAPKSTQPL